MKKILILPLIAISLFLTACEGPQGPPGPPGNDGINILGQVFEVTINLNENNSFQRVVNIPSAIEVYESDVILVYRWEGTFDGADIWTPLPATYFSLGDTFLYTFNHTFFDVKFFLDGNFDLTELGSEWTDDQSFRIAIVPAEFGQADLTMEQLENSPQVEFLGN
ncbi:MAG TPA: hypothetical protein DCS66_05225 [Flavobacteriaceae bacterium]|jgi:hypothetical protein|nr:hypothetical protein [Flavobacteriaceae bacterium]HAT63989.1 hypothetical protein [Flavobacteriaceae bacterium]|tara:strand:+ start:386 stop:880 length:495 start_codon:yes stop_codon:yes gene_type:complete